MSVVVGDFNKSSVKPLDSVCYDNNLVNSKGIYLGDKPLNYSLPILLLEISLMFFVTTATHYVLKRLGQSRFVSQLVAGIILGPSVIGQSLEFRMTLFPLRSTFILDTISNVSLLFFVFIIGVKTDLTILRKPGRQAVTIGVVSSLVPFAIATTTFLTLKHEVFPQDMQHNDLVFQLAARLSLSSFAVIADMLEEFKLLNSEIGRIALSASLITDISSWTVNAFVAAYALIVLLKTAVMGIAVILTVVAFMLILVFVVRPAVLWAVKRTKPGELLSEGYFVGLVLLALVAAFTTEMMGFHPALGPLLLGLTLPGGMPLGVTLTERLEPLFINMFLPIYLVLAGYRTDFTKFKSVQAWLALEMVVVICYVGKLVGSVAASMYFEMPFRDAISLALILNLKGIVEIYFINGWGDTQKATAEHYSVLTLSMLVITALSTPLIKFLYNPSIRYAVQKRRTLEQLKPQSELRVVACVHNEDQVSAILDILEVSNATREFPISLTVLHLTELVGSAAAILRPHKRSRHSNNPTASDRIVNAFRYFEQQSTGAVTIHPFVAAAPYATMHNDVCSVALDRKVRLILLPFHKQSDGAQETSNPTYQSINQNVLAYAPCSVAILVDRGIPTGTTCAHTNSLLQRVAVYFLGGPDDREALAYGARMVQNRSISLTVVRFLPRDESAINNGEKMIDDAMLGDFQEDNVQNERVIYMEKIVENGEGTAAVLQAMSQKFELLIVGRRKGVDSVLTAGLSEWSENPELGIIGDMLATTDFGVKLSILVVQQQKRVGGGDAAGGADGRREQGNIAAGNLRGRGGRNEETRNALIHRET